MLILFYIFASVILIGLCLCCFAQKLSHAVMGLAAVLAGVAGFYFLMQAEFLAAVQLSVVIGGTIGSILVGLLLTRKNAGTGVASEREIFAAIFVAGLVAGLLILLLTRVAWSVRAEGSLWGTRVLGTAMLSSKGGYLIPVIMMAVLLSAALVGGVYLARTRKGADPDPGPARKIAASPERKGRES